MTKSKGKKKDTNAYMTYFESKSLDMNKYKDKFSPEYWDYRRRWEENPMNLVIERGPLHVVLEMTTVCNLRCTFCQRTVMINEKTFKQPIKHMEMDFVKKVIDEMAILKIPSLALNGWGEPVLHSRLHEMVAYAKKKGILDVFFHTNASLMNEYVARKVIEAGLDKVIFSVDAPDKSLYEKRRKGFNVEFEKVEYNINRLIDIRDEMGKDFPIVRLTMNLTPDIPKSVSDSFHKKWEKKADIISFQQYSEPPRKDDQYPVSTYNPEFVNCPQLYHRIYICIDGIVAPCCGDSGYREMPIGDLNKDTIEDIWNGTKLNKLRKIISKGEYFKLPACRKCIMPLEHGFCKTGKNIADTPLFSKKQPLKK